MRETIEICMYKNWDNTNEKKVRSKKTDVRGKHASFEKHKYSAKIRLIFVSSNHRFFFSLNLRKNSILEKAKILRSLRWKS